MILNPDQIKTEPNIAHSDEVIERVEHKGDQEILRRVIQMSLNPFNDEWGLDKEEEERFYGDVPKYKRAMLCSCSS
ncbi:hypothetical protein IFM47457_02681 [Aspergillus lentulus]|nr:hypothetical protein IFM47457_02681 [Aspergillus lentulus]